MKKASKLLDQCTTKIADVFYSIKAVSNQDSVLLKETQIPICKNTSDTKSNESVYVTNFTIVGSSLTITSDQFLVAMTLADNGSNKNIYLPENPKLGETHIVKAYTVGGYGSSVCNVFANTNNSLNRFDGGYGKGFTALTLMAGLGSTTGGGAEVVYVGNHTWLVVGITGNVNFRMENM